VKVFLMRHGEAEPYRSPDAERALTARGWEQANEVGDWLASVLTPDVPGGTLLASPYRRAQETASAVNKHPRLPVLTVGWLTPDVDPRRAVAALQSLSDGIESVVIVSHMPLVAAVFHLIEEGSLGAGQAFVLAEMRALEMPALMPGLGVRAGGFIPGK
jgi:phosphohistidine phosphatase